MIDSNGARNLLDSVSAATVSPTEKLDVDFAEAIVELAPDAVLVVDQAGRVELANRCAENMFGYPRETLVGLGVEALVPARLEAAHRAHRSEYAALPITRPMDVGHDLWGRRADGSEFPVEINLSPVTVGEGTHVVVTVHDASKRQANERALRDQMAVAEEKADGAVELHEFVIGRLFSAGLGIASVLGRVAGDQARQLGVVTHELDDAIRAIRTVALNAGAPAETDTAGHSGDVLPATG